MKKLLLINGATLNRLHTRDASLFGGGSLEDLVVHVRAYANKCGFELDHFHSNHEGEIVDVIQNAEGKYDGIIINPGAFTPYGNAIRVILGSMPIPSVEVHFVNIHKTGESTVPGKNATGVISGFGINCYLLGVDAIRHYLDSGK